MLSNEGGLPFNSFDESTLARIAKEMGLSISLRSANPADWPSVLADCRYVPNIYSSASVDYQLAYQEGQGGTWKDFSMVVYWDRSPAAVWPFTLSLTNAVPSLTSQGQLLAPPLLRRTLAKSSEKTLAKLCVDFAHRVAHSVAIRSFNSCDPFTNELGLSDWHVESMAQGANCRVQHDLFLRTSDTWDDILKSYKKRLRHTMMQAKKLWKSFILDASAKEPDTVWDTFKALHIQVSGRQTRSDVSWLRQLDAIRDGEAFLVYLLDDQDRLIGGGFFTLTKNEGLYAVGVYDRELFDKPVGYLVQYEAIQEMVRRGIQWYKLGALPFASDITAPTEKEISIGAFKKHFCSHTLPKLILSHTVEA